MHNIEDNIQQQKFVIRKNLSQMTSYFKLSPVNQSK